MRVGKQSEKSDEEEDAPQQSSEEEEDEDDHSDESEEEEQDDSQHEDDEDVKMSGPSLKRKARSKSSSAAKRARGESPASDVPAFLRATSEEKREKLADVRALRALRRSEEAPQL